MNKLFIPLTIMLSLVAMFGLTSCGDDPEHGDKELWKGELAAPEFADDAALFRIEGSDLYSYIELSESGIYFVIPAQNDNINYSSNYNMPMHERFAASRASDSETGIISGRYSVVSKTEYRLENFGVVTYDEAKRTLGVTTVAGVKLTYKAIKEKNMASNALNDRLCRTWQIKSARMEFLDDDMKVVGEYTFTPSQVEEEYVESFTFTRSGMMYEYDGPDDSGVYKWQWTNSVSQILALMGFDDYDGAGMVQVYFDNEKATFMMPSECDGYNSDYYDTPDNASYQKEYITCTPYKY